MAKSKYNQYKKYNSNSENNCKAKKNKTANWKVHQNEQKGRFLLNDLLAADWTWFVGYHKGKCSFSVYYLVSLAEMIEFYNCLWPWDMF